MLVSVIQIGNSKGIIIPKSILQQLNIEDSVELEVLKEGILLKPAHKNMKEGLSEALNQDDKLQNPDSLDIDHPDWEWS